ncbi:MAG: SMP-30/gluconolactonase/LRE family protein [Bryobacterales bacterium]
MLKLMTLGLLLLLASLPLAAQNYVLGPDSQRQAGVPEGKLVQRTWKSQIFPGTERDYWIYVPAQYKADAAAAVMLFQDGASYINTGERGWQTPIVLDNLIHKGEIPVMIGIFINPGVMPAQTEQQQARYNRSFEYDALGDRYARFLLEEILPDVAKDYNLSDDPNARGIGGSSSGAICAFTAAWERPDSFRRVLSFIGTYVNIRGGQIYPTLIRKTEPKPLRIFLQDGDKDLNIYAGNWWIANQDMTSSLEYAGYETMFVKGAEGHNNLQGRAVLPDALRWLWKDYPKPIVASRGGPGERHSVTEWLDPNEDWELVGEGYRFTEGPAVDPDGNLFFVDVRNNRIHRVDSAGKVSVFKEDSGGASGLMFGADGKLYAAQNGSKRIVAYTLDGTETVLAEDVAPNDLAVSAKGDIYFTDPANKKVWRLDKQGNKSEAHEGIERPNGIVLSPDQSLLMVADSWNKWVWSFQVLSDGSLANGQPFYRLETPDQSSRSSADGMTVDDQGRLYVTTSLGLQVCDQTGRVNAIISKPQPGPLANVVFAGPDLQTLYVTAGDKVFRTKVRAKGVRPWELSQPPRPGL